MIAPFLIRPPLLSRSSGPIRQMAIYKVAVYTGGPYRRWLYTYWSYMGGGFIYMVASYKGTLHEIFTKKSQHKM